MGEQCLAAERDVLPHPLRVRAVKALRLILLLCSLLSLSLLSLLLSLVVVVVAAAAVVVVVVVVVSLSSLSLITIMIIVSIIIIIIVLRLLRGPLEPVRGLQLHPAKEVLDRVGGDGLLAVDVLRARGHLLTTTPTTPTTPTTTTTTTTTTTLTKQQTHSNINRHVERHARDPGPVLASVALLLHEHVHPVQAEEVRPNNKSIILIIRNTC